MEGFAKRQVIFQIISKLFSNDESQNDHIDLYDFQNDEFEFEKMNLKMMNLKMKIMKLNLNLKIMRK